MRKLLTHNRYAELGGTCDHMDFVRYVAKAEALIHDVTHGRLDGDDPIPDSVEFAVFDIVNAMHEDALNGSATREITSMSNDGVSVTYAASGLKPSAAISAKYMSIVRGYLRNETDSHGTMLLYCGVN